jgi:hypothetical protein
MDGTQMLWEPGSNFGPNSWKINHCKASRDGKTLSGLGCLQNIQTWSMIVLAVFQLLTPLAVPEQNAV